MRTLSARGFALISLAVTALVFLPVAVSGEASLYSGFTFAAAGDHSASSRFHASLDALNQSGASFYLALGDLAYSQIEQSWCQQWLTGSGNPSGKSFKNIVLLAGNHDSGEDGSANINLYTQYCGLGPLSPSAFTSSSNQIYPQNGCVWPDTVRKCYGKEYYFDWPPTGPTARFIIVSSGIDYNVDNGEKWVYDQQVGIARYEFVKNAIDSARAQGIQWVIVATHKTYLETDAIHSSVVDPPLFNLLVEKRVDLILEGHAHNYERTGQLALSTFCPSITTTYNPACVASSGSRFYKDKGTIVAIAGTFGTTLSRIVANESDTPYFQALNDTTWGFLKVAVSPMRLDAQFMPTSGGSFADSFTILSTSAYAYQFDWADFNNDGAVNIIELATIATLFGQSCLGSASHPEGVLLGRQW